MLRGLLTGLEMGDSAPVIDDSHPPVDMEEICFKATSDPMPNPEAQGVKPPFSKKSDSEL